MIKDEFGGWQFNLKERAALTDILKDKFEREQIDTFLIWLEYICFQMKIWQDLPSFQEVEGYAEPILNSIKKTTDFLRLVEKEKIAKGIPFGFPNFIGSDRERHLFVGGKVVSTLDNRHHNSNHVLNIIQTAKTAIPLLEELQSQFERQLREWKGEPVKPSADSHSFVFDIAKRYFEIFHIMPTTTKKGTFDKVVCIALKSVNLPFEYPERKVRAAVKKLKATIAT